MYIRKKMKDRYRSFSFLTDIGGIKSAIGEARGFGFPKQPALNKACVRKDGDPVPDESGIPEALRKKKQEEKV